MRGYLKRPILIYWLITEYHHHEVSSSSFVIPTSTTSNSFVHNRKQQKANSDVLGNKFYYNYDRPPASKYPSSLSTTTNNAASISSSSSQQEQDDDDKIVTILQRGQHHIIAMKPPSVVCHHSNWTGSRKKKLKAGEEPEIPMLQRVRDAIGFIDRQNSNSCGDESEIESNHDDEDVKKINLVHRLDRGASGILLCAFANDNDTEAEETLGVESRDDTEEEVDSKANKHNQEFTIIKKIRTKGPTAILQDEMSKSSTTKTYVALVRGEGILHGEDMKEKGWFEVNRPIKDEKGRLNDATTLFNFVAGQAESQGGNDLDEKCPIMQPRISLVLARPKDGRWHQIRRHLNGLSHPILGDTSHGSSKANREWKEKRNLPGERTCLHLARLEMLPTKYTPDGIDVSCPLPQDMLDMLKVYAPEVLNQALPILEQEGILIDKPKTTKYLVGKYKIPATLLEQMTLGNNRGTEIQDTKILSRGDHYVVVSKPHGVVVHNSSWTGRNESPMLQRVRDAVGRKVNPIHRLDRSASGCLVFAFADNNDDESDSRDVTNTLIQSLQSDDASKTYLAICDGDGEWNGLNFLEKGWFMIDRPIKDENDKVIDAKTDVRFIASVTLPLSENDDVPEGRKVCIVLAKPHTGRYHQVRQHLASGSIGHAILGDSSHGLKRTNRIWKKKRGLVKERTCLHLARIDLPPTKYSPDGIKATSPLPEDLHAVLNNVPGLTDKARPILAEEDISI